MLTCINCNERKTFLDRQKKNGEVCTLNQVFSSLLELLMVFEGERGLFYSGARIMRD